MVSNVNRIISLAPSNTEILFFLGLGNRIVGVSEQCDYPPEAVPIKKAGSFVAPDVEKIIVESIEAVANLLHPEISL